MPSVVNNTLSRVEDVIYQEEDKDQRVIFLEGGNDPNTIDIDEDPE